jgi:hypothetical protein
VVDLRAEVTGMLGGESNGTASAQVTIVSTAGQRAPGPGDRRAAGRSGPHPDGLPAAGLQRLPAEVQPEAEVDCDRAARRPLLSEAAVVVTFLLANRVPRDQLLPVPSEQVRKAVLAACDLPDPRADLTVEASASGDALLLFVAGVPRSKTELRLEEILVPGYVVTG